MSKTSQGSILEAIMLCRALKSNHKLVMVSILLHVTYGTSGNSFPGHKTISMETGLSMRTVVYVLHWLETNGFITCTSIKSRKGGKKNFTVYTINIVKIGIVEDTAPAQNGYIPARIPLDDDFNSWQKAESEKQNVRTTRP